MALRKMTKAMSLRKVGDSLGVSAAYIYDLVNKRRGISESLAGKLGFSLVPPPTPEERKWVRK